MKLSPGAWALLGVALTVGGTIVTVLLTRGAQREATKVKEGADLLHSQVEFMQQQEATIARMALEVREQRDRADHCSDQLDECRDHNTLLRGIVTNQINIEAAATEQAPPHDVTGGKP